MNILPTLLTLIGLLSGLIAAIYSIRASRVAVEYDPLAQSLAPSGRADEGAEAANAMVFALKALDETKGVSNAMSRSAMLNRNASRWVFVTIALNTSALITSLLM